MHMVVNGVSPWLSAIRSVFLTFADLASFVFRITVVPHTFRQAIASALRVLGPLRVWWEGASAGMKGERRVAISREVGRRWGLDMRHSIV